MPQLQAYDHASGGLLEKDILSARRSVWGVDSSTAAEIRKSRTTMLTDMKVFGDTGVFEIEYSFGSARVLLCRQAWVALTS
jgi:hypothetical protein